MPSSGFQKNACILIYAMKTTLEKNFVLNVFVSGQSMENDNKKNMGIFGTSGKSISFCSFALKADLRYSTCTMQLGNTPLRNILISFGQPNPFFGNGRKKTFFREVFPLRTV